VGEPIDEYQWSANGNITYVPAYGKFAGFGDFIFHYDFFVLAGGGAISTRPIPVIDPDNRTFTFKPKPQGRIGGGLRIFFNRWLAAVIEVDDYIYPEQLENPTIAQGTPNGMDPTCPKGAALAAQCSSTWLLSGSSITNNVQAQIGLSFFLPFTWEYRLPK
jgi:outer membrane beta-barrel protein